MSEELKACPFCGSEAEHSTNKSTIFVEQTWAWCPNKDCVLRDTEDNDFLYMHSDVWNTRPIEDGLRSQLDAMREHYHQMSHQLAASQAEVERLKGIIRGVEGESYNWHGIEFRECCNTIVGKEHDESCSFYQWEGGAQ